MLIPGAIFRATKCGRRLPSVNFDSPMLVAAAVSLSNERPAACQTQTTTAKLRATGTLKGGTLGSACKRQGKVHPEAKTRLDIATASFKPLPGVPGLILGMFYLRFVADLVLVTCAVNIIPLKVRCVGLELPKKAV